MDCISTRPYRGEEIRMLSEAIAKTKRPIALSLSPGPAPLDKVDEMRKYAQMWRISNDIWDLWHSTVDYPQGLGDQFANLLKWAGKVTAWALAGRGYVATGLSWARSGVGQAARDATDARRAAHADDAVGDISLHR